MTLQLGLIHCSAVLYKLWVLCTRTAAGSKPYPMETCVVQLIKTSAFLSLT